MAKTKNHTLAFQLTVDTKNFTSGMNLSKKEIQQAKREMTGLLTPAEKMEVKLHKLGELAKKDAKFQGVYNEALKRSQKQMQATSKSATNLGTSIKTMAGAYITFQTAMSLGRGFVDEINKLDALGKQAELTGFSVTKLDQIQKIARRTGGLAIEQTADLLDDFVVKSGEARKGEGEFFDAFTKQMGMTEASIKRIANLPVDERFEETRKAIAALTDQTDRMTAADKIFGGEGKKLATMLGMQNKQWEEQLRLHKEIDGIKTKTQVSEAQRVKKDLAAANAEIDSLKAELTLLVAPTAGGLAKAARALRRPSPEQVDDIRFGSFNISRRWRKFGNSMMEGNLPIPTAKTEERERAKASKKADDERKTAEIFEKITSRLVSPSEFLRELFSEGAKHGQGLKSRLDNIHIRKMPAEVAPKFEMQARKGMTGPMASAGAGSSAAFRLLNQTATVQSVEVQMAKTRTEKAVETVTVLEQMKELMAKNHWQQKEYNEQQDEK